jgi:hypothetical protein
MQSHTLDYSSLDLKSPLFWPSTCDVLSQSFQLKTDSQGLPCWGVEDAELEGPMLQDRHWRRAALLPGEHDGLPQHKSAWCCRTWYGPPTFLHPAPVAVGSLYIQCVVSDKKVLG